MEYVYIETFGCSANKNNSEILKGILKQSGYEITNNEKIADIIIINTCVVKSKTESKIKRRIQNLAKKSKKKLIIVAGCMPETDAKQIKQLNEKAILLGTHHFKDILKLIRKYKEDKLSWEEQNYFLDFREETKVLLPKISNNKLISITQISEGCLGQCKFCKARLAKGKLFSYDMNDILKSIESDLQNGAKEIWLTSQDNANYNLDNGSQELPRLLKNIFNLNHRFKLRLGMMDPNNVIPILDSLIGAYKHPKMYKFLHIPIQSASNKVLKDMNRLYNIEDAELIINKFRQQFPNITIATDIIVGYPTETQEEHIENINFIKKYYPDVFNLSKFSSHKQTSAGKLKTLNSKIIHKRAYELMQTHRQTTLENKQKFLGKNILVSVNKKLGENLYEARDDYYNIVIINSKNKILGKNIKVKIRQIGIHHMIGEII